MPHRLGILAMPGSNMYELSVPFEVFGTDRSDLVDDWYRTEFIAAGTHGARAFALTGEAPLSTASEFDTLVVPPVRPIDGDYSARVVQAIVKAHEGGTRIVSLCTGAFVVAAAGLLDGRSATTHWMYSGLFRERFPQVDLTPDVLYVDNGDVLTSAGKSAAMDLCLYLVAKDHGSRLSNEIARRLVIPPHRVGNQAQFMNRTAVSGDLPPVLVELGAWMRARLDEPVTADDMARHANLSTRQLARVFRNHFQMSPHQWLEQERIFLAQRQLESGGDTATVVAERSGFGSYASLRRAFKRNLGLAPEEYRRSFREAFVEDRETR